jgi:hypothetical protein
LSWLGKTQKILKLKLDTTQCQCKQLTQLILQQFKKRKLENSNRSSSNWHIHISVEEILQETQQEGFLRVFSGFFVVFCGFFGVF